MEVVDGVSSVHGVEVVGVGVEVVGGVGVIVVLGPH